MPGVMRVGMMRPGLRIRLGRIRLGGGLRRTFGGGPRQRRTEP